MDGARLQLTATGTAQSHNTSLFTCPASSVHVEVWVKAGQSSLIRLGLRSLLVTRQPENAWCGLIITLLFIDYSFSSACRLLSEIGKFSKMLFGPFNIQRTVYMCTLSFPLVISMYIQS